jgi:hypothetical protein
MDAELAVQNGIDGILVSNHGGRGEDNGRAVSSDIREFALKLSRVYPLQAYRPRMR